MQSHSDRKGLSNIAYSYRILRALFSRARAERADHGTGMR